MRQRKDVEKKLSIGCNFGSIREKEVYRGSSYDTLSKEQGNFLKMQICIYTPGSVEHKRCVRMEEKV